MNERNLNPYEAPQHGGATVSPPSYWRAAFVRGVIATVIGFILVEIFVFAAYSLSLDPYAPGPFALACKTSIVILAAGVISIVITGCGWFIAMLIRLMAR